MALYFRNVGTAWNSNTSWSTTSSSGSSAGVIPTATDDVILDSGSANCPVTTTIGVCKTINTTGYVNTLTLTVGINVFGNITIGVGTLWAGASSLSCHADTTSRTATITSNSNIIGNPFTFFSDTASCTFTLSGDLRVNALVTTTGSAIGLTTTINSGNIYCQKGLTLNSVGGSGTLTTGTATIQLVGTGSLITGNGGTTQNNIIINTAGTITWTGTAGSVGYNTGTFTYIAGTISGTASSTLTLSGAATLDWNNGGLNTILPVKIAFNATATYTLISNAYTSLGFTNANNMVIVVNGFNIFIYGGTLQYYQMSGTTNLFIKGGPTTMNTSSAGLSNNVTFDSGSGTITLASNIFSSGTLTYTSGVMNPTGNFAINGSTTFNTVGMSFGTLTINGFTGTLTLNSTLSANVLNSGATNVTLTYGGSAGFNVNTWNMTGFNGTNVLTVGNTYVVNTSINIQTSNIATPNKIISSSPGTRATLNLGLGAVQSNHYVIATDIDSSAGQTIWVWKPTLSNTLNWNNLTSASMQSAYTFLS